MQSFFFIPATRLSKIDAIRQTGAGEIIIDFEDAVLDTDRQRLAGSIESIEGYAGFWYRVPLRADFDQSLDLHFLKDLLTRGVSRLVLPKLVSAQEFEYLLDQCSGHNITCIILVEHPRLLLECAHILQRDELSRSVYGIGTGSHDLMGFMNAHHTEEQTVYPRIQVLYLSKAYHKIAIDIASMNITDAERFKDEVQFGIRNGFDAKFVIHPKQQAWLSEAMHQQEEKALGWARKIMAALPPGYTGNEVEPFLLDGTVIEKPHVLKAQTILKKFDNE